MRPALRILAITTMRNEAPFILEWLAYHQHIGVTDFIVFSNDCEDGTDAMLDRLDAMGVLSHVRNHSGGKKTVQWRALTKAGRHPLVQDADWVYGTDVDEFLCIHAGDGMIADLMMAAPEAQGFAIPWRMFGNAGIQVFDDAPLTEQFTKAAPEALVWPWRAVQYKSLYRQCGRYDKLGIHRPKTAQVDALADWVDGNGNALPRHLGTVVPTTAPRYGLAQINHYAIGSVESFLVKAARGKPNHTSDPIDLAYWSDRNFNTVTDTRIQRHSAAIREGIAAFKQDDVIAELHQAGVAWRKAKIDALLHSSDYFYLMARIRQMPDTPILEMSEQVSLLKQLFAIRRAITQQKRDEKYQ
jgi:hypothetical protein